MSVLFQPTPEQVAREIEKARLALLTERAWRRRVAGVILLGFLAQTVAIGIGLASFAVDDVELGKVLLKVGEGGSVLFPFVVAVLWVSEASRRGDL